MNVAPAGCRLSTSDKMVSSVVVDGAAGSGDVGTEGVNTMPLGAAAADSACMLREAATTSPVGVSERAAVLKRRELPSLQAWRWTSPRRSSCPYVRCALTRSALVNGRPSQAAGSQATRWPGLPAAVRRMLLRNNRCLGVNIIGPGYGVLIRAISTELGTATASVAVLSKRKKVVPFWWQLAALAWAARGVCVRSRPAQPRGVCQMGLWPL